MTLSLRHLQRHGESVIFLFRLMIGAPSGGRPGASKACGIAGVLAFGNLPADREGLAAPMPASAARRLYLLAKLAPAFEP